MAADTLRDVLRRSLNDSGKTPEQVAQELKVSYRTLMHFFGDIENRRFPAEWVAQFCKAVGSYAPLDFMEREAGRVGFPIPSVDKTEAEQVLNVTKLMKESSEAINTLYGAIADGRIDQREIEVVTAELDDVIRQCARLRYWLQQNAGRLRTH